MTMWPLLLSTGSTDNCFRLVIFVVASLLYLNSLDGGFVWDDRAAVIHNADVSWHAGLYDVLRHDFWGQDIKLVDSHKSYRPITVLTFKFNFALSGLSEFGFHLTNLIIYSAVCVIVYHVALQWLNRHGARLCALLFTVHPVHVEAVASVVGRADSLCGLFYTLALICYTSASSGQGGAAPDLLRVALFVLSLCLAVLASLSKEVGVTVFGMFVVVEVLQKLKDAVSAQHKSSDVHHPVVTTAAKMSRQGGLGNSHGSPAKALQNHQQANNLRHDAVQPSQHPAGSGLRASFSANLRTIFLAMRHTAALNSSSFARTAVSFTTLAIFMRFRLQMNGEHQLYQWTVSENHVSLLPSLRDRALSYAQMHFWYAAKLVYPRHLCFDYGFACIPTVHSLLDVRNCLPLLAYGALALLVVKAVAELRVTIIFSTALLVLSLLPALNIFFPIGTLLAERLLFVPSIGFCMLCGELLSVDLAAPLTRFSELFLDTLSNWFYHRLQDLSSTNGVTASSPHKSKKHARVQHNLSPLGIKSAYLLLSPVFVLCALRVLSRNLDWRNEMALYSSALSVCPRSSKSLTNYAVLALSENKVEAAIDAALAAVEIDPHQMHAMVNAALAYQRQGDYVRSAHQFQRALREQPKNAKANGYYGSLLYMWSNRAMDPNEMRALREEAARKLMTAVSSGFNAPATLHRLGSVHADLGNYKEGIAYLEAALLESEKRAAARRGARYVQTEDDINEAYTHNQLGMVHWKAQHTQQAIDSFEAGLRADPTTVQIHTNLGNLYRDLGMVDLAREVMGAGIASAGDGVPAALLNNLGLLELDTGHHQAALDMFQAALKQAQDGLGMLEGSVTADGASVLEVINNNIARARHGLDSHSR